MIRYDLIVTLAERSMQVLQKLILTALKSALFIGLPSRTDTYDDDDQYDNYENYDIITIMTYRGILIVYTLY